MPSGKPSASLLFTDHVRALGPAAGPPAAREIEEMLAALRGALVKEMRRRSLWSAPPRALGIPGPSSWSEEALDDLVQGFYVAVFIDRLPGLRAQLRVRDNVEGLVFTAIRSHLHDLQRKHDPLGYRVFRVLHEAVRVACANGTLEIAAGDERMRNNTTLAVPAWPADAPLEPVTGGKLEARVRAWADELAPDLVTARGRRLDEIAGRLAERLSRLADEGIVAWHFGDVIRLLKAGVRARWQMIWGRESGTLAFEEDDDEEVMTLVEMVRPARGFEERQAFTLLLECVATAIERRAGGRRRGDLEGLWDLLRTWAASDHGDKPPSHRRIAGQLGIARGRLPDLFVFLGDWTNRCRAAGGLFEKAVVKGIVEESQGGTR